MSESEGPVLERLRQETIDDGQDHPFVKAMIKVLRQRHADMLARLETIGATGDGQASYMFSLAGRAAELRAVIAEIENARGVVYDEK